MAQKSIQILLILFKRELDFWLAGENRSIISLKVRSVLGQQLHSHSHSIHIIQSNFKRPTTVLFSVFTHSLAQQSHLNISFHLLISFHFVWIHHTHTHTHTPLTHHTVWRNTMAAVKTNTQTECDSSEKI